MSYLKSMIMHTPIPPCDEVMAKLPRYTVDVQEGRVYNTWGREVFTCPNNNGYHSMRILYSGGARRVNRHHLVWWAHYGEWPTQMLDHEDRDQTNDKITNLRYSNPVANRRNAKDMRGI